MTAINAADDIIMTRISPLNTTPVGLKNPARRPVHSAHVLPVLLHSAAVSAYLFCRGRQRIPFERKSFGNRSKVWCAPLGHEFVDDAGTRLYAARTQRVRLYTTEYITID